MFSLFLYFFPQLYVHNLQAKRARVTILLETSDDFLTDPSNKREQCAYGEELLADQVTGGPVS